MWNFEAGGMTRRNLCGGLLALAAPTAARAATAGRPRVVTVLGDSITAGYGLPFAQSLPVQLEAELNRRGANVRVRGAGVSGDTTAGGLGRVDFSVQKDSDLCIVALGGNDLLRALAPATTQRNLTAIIRKLKARRIPVLLVGLKPPPLVEPSYVRQFDAIFPAVARTEHVPLYPDLLAGVALNRQLNQGDGIHPNAQGVKVIAARLAPVVQGALGRARAAA